MRKNIIYIVLFSLLSSCFYLDWNFKQNPYELMNVLKKTLSGQPVEYLSTYFGGSEAICLYTSKKGLEFLRDKAGDALQYLMPDRDLYAGDKTYDYLIVDSRNGDLYFDVTVKCTYGKHNYCTFTKIENLTDSEKLPDIPICLR